MIVSHTHRFIFLRTKKTASTSLQIALSAHCGPGDVISGLNPPDTAFRLELGGRGTQNTRVPFYRYGLRDWWHLLRHGSTVRFYNHMSAAEMRRRLGPATWARYFKFCVERNPWDRAISLYYWRARHLTPRPSLSEYLHTVGRADLTNFPLYTIDGEVAVDRVLRYEDLDNEVHGLARQLGLAGVTLPRAKGEHRRDRRPSREVLSPEDRELIRTVCRREIELFGYEC